MSNTKSKSWIEVAVFSVACIFLAFMAGMLVSILRLYPTEPVEQAVTAVDALLKEGAGANTTTYLHSARYSESGVTVFDENATSSGITLVTSYWRDGSVIYPGIRLLNMDGTVINEWRIDPLQIWTETPYDDYAGGASHKGDNYVHGTWLLENGDVVFNIEYLGLVRMDACGKVIWKLPVRTHHSVFRNDDGNFWVAGLRWQEEALDKYPHLRPPYVDEFLLLVSPEGEELRRISVLEAIYESDHVGLLASGRSRYDVTHMNDVEELSEEFADDFPLFEAGDLLVSLRNLNLIFVIDGKTERIKWYLSHPLLRQHDADFVAGGRISVFDNHDEYSETATQLGGSRILIIDPETNDFSIRYTGSAEQPFYSKAGGKQQALPNGNHLITEAFGSRVFEVTPDGETVWSWQADIWPDNLAPEILEGTRYPQEMATVCRDN
jgi:hypothetical protein